MYHSCTLLWIEAQFSSSQALFFQLEFDFPSLMTLIQVLLNSSTPATPSHFPNKRCTSVHSFAASSSSPASSMALSRDGAAKTHRTVACSCRFLEFFDSLSPSAPSIWDAEDRSRNDVANNAAVSAMCDIAGDKVEVAGVRGSMFIRI